MLKLRLLMFTMISFTSLALQAETICISVHKDKDGRMLVAEGADKRLTEHRSQIVPLNAKVDEILAIVTDSPQVICLKGTLVNSARFYRGGGFDVYTYDAIAPKGN